MLKLIKDIIIENNGNMVHIKSGSIIKIFNEAVDPDEEYAGDYILRFMPGDNGPWPVQLEEGEDQKTVTPEEAAECALVDEPYQQHDLLNNGKYDTTDRQCVIYIYPDSDHLGGSVYISFTFINGVLIGMHNEDLYEIGQQVEDMFRGMIGKKIPKHRLESMFDASLSVEHDDENHMGKFTPNNDPPTTIRGRIL